MLMGQKPHATLITYLTTNIRKFLIPVTMAKRNAKHMKSDFKRKARELANFINNDLPDFAAEEMQNIVDDSFAKEQYQGDKTASKWASTSKKNIANDRKERNALLVETGELIASTEAEAKGTSIRVSSDRQTSKGKWNLAQIHNEGLDPQEKRQFMPIPGEESEVFTEKLEKVVNKEFNKILK